MLEGLRHLFSSRPTEQIVRDFVDIIIVAYLTYRALLVLRGTRAMQMGLGLGIVGLVYFGAKLLKLTTLLNLLSWLLSSIILIIVVVFQNDIRRALIRVGGKAWFSGGREQQSRVIDEVVAAATELARHRMGAIIAFEQDANLLEFVKSEGIPIESHVTRELLVSMFVPESVNKLHDGAVLIRDLKIARAGVFFPMPDTKILDASLGSRHRAALGITEETDAVVVVVSEERGTISFCFSGNIVTNLDGQSLRQALLGLFGRVARTKKGAAPAPVKKVAAASTAGVRTATIPPPPPAGQRPTTLVSSTLGRDRDRDRDQPPVSQRPPPSKTMTSTPMRSGSDTLRPTNDVLRPVTEPIRSGSEPLRPASEPLRPASEPPSDKSKAADSVLPASTAQTPRVATFVPSTQSASSPAQPASGPKATPPSGDDGGSARTSDEP
jgi:diadenylate cyclase